MIIFQEKVSDTKRNRQELNKMLDILQPGNVIIVTDLTRLSCLTKDLFKIVDIINSKSNN